MISIDILVNKFYAIIAVEFFHCQAGIGNILYYHETLDSNND